MQSTVLKLFIFRMNGRESGRSGVIIVHFYLDSKMTIVTQQQVYLCTSNKNTSFLYKTHEAISIFIFHFYLIFTFLPITSCSKQLRMRTNFV